MVLILYFRQLFLVMTFFLFFHDRARSLIFLRTLFWLLGSSDSFNFFQRLSYRLLLLATSLVILFHKSWPLFFIEDILLVHFSNKSVRWILLSVYYHSCLLVLGCVFSKVWTRQSLWISFFHINWLRTLILTIKNLLLY